MLICIKQHLSNIWSSIHEKLRTTEAELKKSVAYEKACILPHARWKLSKGPDIWHLSKNKGSIAGVFQWILRSFLQKSTSI